MSSLDVIAPRKHAMMAVVSNRDFKSQLLTVVRGARAVCVGLGYSLLVLAAGVALWGWLVSESSIFEGQWNPFDRVHGYYWRHNFPGGPAATLLVAVAALIGVSVYAWVRRGRLADHIVRASATLAVLYFAIFSFGLPAFYHLVMGNFPVTSSVPLVVAAWLLALAGAAAVLAATAMANLTRRTLPFVIGGAVVGVTAAVVLTVLAVGAGDDGRYINATVASSTDLPAAPTKLGQRRFTVKVSDWAGSRQDQPDFQVATAGAGLVTFHQGQVTGYGNDGKERWHYRRTGPGKVAAYGLRVFDDGHTVVVALNAGPDGQARVLVGLDAVTGREIWSQRSTLPDPEANSFRPDRNMHGVERHEPSPFLIANRSSDKSAWTRYDTKTGKPMWTVDSPVGHGCSGRVADTDSLIATATMCPVNGSMNVGVVLQDPASGKQVWQATLVENVPDQPDHRFGMQATPAGRDGIEVAYGPANAPTNRVYVNVLSHNLRDLGPDDRVAASTEPGDVFVMQHQQPDVTQLSLYGTNGVQRCGLSPDLKLKQALFGDYDLYLPLYNAVVFYDTNAHALQTVDATTCAVGGTQPVSAATDWLGTAPGLVWLQRVEHDGTYVDGYS
jgi:hypothetical protein